MDPSAVRFNATLPSNMSLSAHLRELAYVRRNPIEGISTCPNSKFDTRSFIYKLALMASNCLCPTCIVGTEWNIFETLK